MMGRIASFLLADKVVFSKLKALPNEQSKLTGKVVAMINPFDKSEIIYRRVVATETLWVKRADDGAII